jgi:transcriptional regulator with XRE-family HTH domain
MEAQLARRIRLCVAQSELTPREVAALCGLSATTLYAWMGGRALPGVAGLAALCRVLGVSSDYLLGLDDIYEERIRRGRKRKKRPGAF